MQTKAVAGTVQPMQSETTPPLHQQEESTMSWQEDDIKRIFSQRDYALGVQYVQKERVQNLTADGPEENCRIHCQVTGTYSYDVMVHMKGEKLQIQCSCPRFADKGICKHVAAALIFYLRQRDTKYKNRSNGAVDRMLQSYFLQSNATFSHEPKVQLRPILHPGSGDSYPTWSFQVGIDKLYMVRDLGQFAQAFRLEKTVVYGKALTLTHRREQFDDHSRELLNLLLDQIPMQSQTQFDHWGLPRSILPKNQIVLTGFALKQWFSLLLNTTVNVADSQNPVCLEESRPQVSVTIRRHSGGAQLQWDSQEDWRFFGDSSGFYGLSAKQFIRCDAEFQKNVQPLLGSASHIMRLSMEDLPLFCSCVVPRIQNMVELYDPDGLLTEFLPDECVPQFYLDLENRTLLLRLAFRYDADTFDLGAAVPPEIKRDVLTEEQAKYLVEQSFQWVRGAVFQWEIDDTALFQLLSEGIQTFQERGEVFLSDRLQGKRVEPGPSAVGVSVSDGMLTVQLDTGGFPPQELEALYQSMLKKRRYHKLTNGRYLALDGSAYETLAEMAHMLQLTPKQLTAGTVELPAFRAPYVEELLKTGENLEVRRDRQFRAMMQQFRSGVDGEYPLPPDLEPILRPYQKTGFQWLKTLESCGFGGILADEMGLGKTLQVIAYLTTVTRTAVGRTSLVVCPASLIFNWMDELARFAPELRAAAILGTAAERRQLRKDHNQADLWVTSYELLRQDIESYIKTEFYCCVLDEAQHIKNQSTQISKAVKRILCQQRFILTGTPIENRLSELWNLFDFLMPGYLFTHRSFVEKLEKPVVKSGDKDAMEQLRRLVQPFLLRRLKKDVLKELPPKIEYVRRIPLSEQERKLYHATAMQARKNLETGKQGKLAILAALTQLRQICCAPELCFENYDGPHSKLDAVLELCSGMVENGHQILLFSQFTSMLDQIRVGLDAHFISHFTLQGSTPKEQRAQLVKAFNRGEASVFLISLKAGGTGLNLTAADVVVHYDPWWNLAAQSQATDRAHRMGQQHHVQVYQMIAKDTIEERILELQSKKAALMETIGKSNEGAILQMSKEELLDLLE